MVGTEKDRKNHFSTRGGSKSNKEANRDDEFGSSNLLAANQSADKFTLMKGKKYKIRISGY